MNPKKAHKNISYVEKMWQKQKKKIHNKRKNLPHNLPGRAGNSKKVNFFET